MDETKKTSDKHEYKKCENLFAFQGKGKDRAAFYLPVVPLEGK